MTRYLSPLAKPSLVLMTLGQKASENRGENEKQQFLHFVFYKSQIF